MKKTSLAVAFFFCMSAAVWGGDWPQWRGPLRSGAVPQGEDIPVVLPPEPRLVWRLKIGDGIASPVVAGGRIVYCDNLNGRETVHAADARDGRELWQASLGPTFSDSQGPTGPRCTPLIDGSRVYAQSCRGEFQCLDFDTGRLLWRTNFSDFGAVFIGEKGNAPGGSRHGNTAAPLVDGDHVFVMVGGTNGAAAACFEKKTGHLLWKSQNHIPGYAAPVLASILGRRQVVMFVADALLALDPAGGDLLWQTPMPTSLGRNVTTPVIIDDVVVAGSFQLGLAGVKISRVDGAFQARKAWVSKEAAMNFSSPVAVGHYVYGLGPAKEVVCVDASDGRTQWRQEGCVSSPPDKAYASFISMGENILMLNDSGELILFRADPARYQEISRVSVCGFNWCSPAYSNGRLYLREMNKTLITIDLLTAPKK